MEELITQLLICLIIIVGFGSTAEVWERGRERYESRKYERAMQRAHDAQLERELQKATMEGVNLLREQRAKETPATPEEG